MFKTAVWTFLLTIMLLVGGSTMVLDGGAEEISEDGGGEVDFPELNVTEERITGILGGGNFIGVHNRDNDAMIGVLYGTPENPNYVHVVSLFTRYLGVADIYGENGAELASGKAIPVRTLYAQRFDTIYEYSDVDKDGIWDSRRMAQQGSGGGSGNDRTSEENSTLEPVFSKVSLRTAWTASNFVRKDNGNGSVEWSVRLTARNLTYLGPLFGLPLRNVGVLEKVELTFHLYVERRDVTREGVPRYRVEVERGMMGGYRIVSRERLEDRAYNGTSISASVKYDHLIAGWDFHARNRNKGLMMSTEVLFLTGYSPRMSEFLRGLRENDIEGNGTVDYETPSGPRQLRLRDAMSVQNGDPVMSQTALRPQVIRKNRLGIADNWQKVGNLRWASNVTVDGAEDEMYFQVHFARAIAGVNVKGAIFAGMGIVGGFSYPGGSRVFHDPIFDVSTFEVRTDLEERDVRWPRLILIGAVMLLASAVVVVLGVTLIAGLIAVKKDRMGPNKDDMDHYDGYYMSKGRGR